MIEIKTVKHTEEISQLVDLFRLSFGRSISEKVWEWKYISNPHISSTSKVIVATDNGKIVGARPFLITELQLGNSKILAAQHCDTMVHPEFRKHGLFNRMGNYAIQYLKEHNFALSYGFPGPMSRVGFLKQGYRIVVPTEMLFIPVNCPGIFSKKLNRKKIGKSLGYIYGIILNHRKRPDIKNTPGIQVEISDKYSADLKELDSWEKKKPLDYSRSERNLRWRFDAHPGHTYKYITVKKNGILSGYAVISVQEQENRLIYGIIVDFLLKNEDLDSFNLLIVKAISELDKTNCDLIVTWAFSEPIYRAELTKRFGFKSTFQFPYKKIIDSGYFEVISLNDQILNGIDIYNSENWRINHIYPDYA